MEKSVMISIRPEWVEKISSGKKNVEIRKTAPKLKPPFKCYIYETQGKTDTPWIDEEGHMIFRGRGMVTGEFVCDFIEPVRKKNKIVMSTLSCVPLPELYEYAGAKGMEGLFGWHISNLKIYDKPKEVSKFKPWKRDCFYSDLGFAIPNCRECHKCKVERPPQSWCYVEELQDGK